MFLPSNITLKFGDSGDFVAELQRRLAMVHCFSNDQVNGFYDGATVNGVMQFQGMNGLHADGVAGPETLRRLNGVIAGDSGSATEDKKDEEQQLQAARDTALVMAVAEQQPVPSVWGEPAPREEAPVHAAPAPQPIGLDPAMFAPAAPLMPELSPLQQADLMREQVAQNPMQDINNLLARAQQQEAVAAQTQQPLPQDPLLQAAPPQQANAIPVYTAPAAPQQAAAPVAPPVAEPAAPVMPQQTQPQQGGGLVQRATRFANAMMQKLADYFEAKLPPSVMAEVQAAGAVMAAAGLREAPIPTGPEMAGQAQALPTRGPEQQPTQVR